MIDLTKITTVAQCDTLLLVLTDPADIALVQAHKAALQNSNGSIYGHLARIVGYSSDLKTCINSTVDQLLDNTISNADEPGLLLGKIQSGKTRAFVGVMGLAFDRGIDVCVVLTKSDNGLVEQTKARMEYEFRDYLSPNSNPRINVSLVDKSKSYTPYEINSQKHILILHKNTTRLDNLIKLFKTTDFKNKKVVIIDDEADFVSRTYYTKNNNVSIGEVGKKIGDFIHTCSYCRYLEVTATPYSLFLQPDYTIQVSNGNAEVFRPRFTVVVPIHSGYIGGKHYFYKSKNSGSMYSHLYYDVSQSCIDHLVIKRNQRIPYNTAVTTPVYTDLRYALMSYFVGSAIRQLQEMKNGASWYQTSFFMHVATENKNHKIQERLINAILSGWANMIISGQLFYIPALFDVVYKSFEDSNKAGNASNEISIAMPNKTDVMDRLLDIFRQTQYSVQVVNSGNKAQLGPDGQLVLTNPLNIFIGGYKLDRGITIANMIGFFYGRNPNTMQADSVLQHHRMYGNRSKEDMAVTRLYTTLNIYQKMEWIDNMDHVLRESFINAMKNPGAGVPVTTIMYDPKSGVTPCGTSKLKLSNLDTFAPFKRITPYGFQTGSHGHISPIIQGIDHLLQSQPGYGVGTPFLMDLAVMEQVIKNIRDTYIYNRAIDNNAGMEWDENEMIAAIRKYTPQDGKVWCYVATNRNLGRIRQNGNFIDAPEDGNTDTPIAYQFTQGPQSHPFLMLFRENGLKSKGWRDTPFYWPALRLPQDIKSCVFCK